MDRLTEAEKKVLKRTQEMAKFFMTFPHKNIEDMKRVDDAMQAQFRDDVSKLWFVIIHLYVFRYFESRAMVKFLIYLRTHGEDVLKRDHGDGEEAGAHARATQIAHYIKLQARAHDEELGVHRNVRYYGELEYEQYLKYKKQFREDEVNLRERMDHIKEEQSELRARRIRDMKEWSKVADQSGVTDDLLASLMKVQKLEDLVGSRGEEKV